MSLRKITCILLFLISFSTSVCYANLKDTNNQADYLIITTEEYSNQMEELASWRKNEGFTVKTVTIPEIQENFPDEQLSMSIRKFISHTLTYWQKPVPRYILLAGGIPLIPSILDYSYVDKDSISIDGYYAININENDVIPDIAIGRLPFRDGAELANMISKIKTFETIDFEKAYKKDFQITVDSAGFENFKYYSDDLIKNIIPSHLRVDTLYLIPGTQCSGEKQDFIDKINYGVVYLANFFHGNPGVWGMKTVLTSADINSGAIHGPPSINVALSCSQRYDDIHTPSLIEKLMSLGNSGLVASYASVGLIYGSYSYFNMEGFFINALNSTFTRIGDVVLKSKKNTGADIEYAKRHNLLGDPALKLPQWLKAPVEEDNSAAGDIALDLSPNPFSEFVNVKIAIGSENRVLLELYDLLGNRIAELNNSVLQPGNYSFPWHSNGSGAVICRLTAGNSTVSKMITCIK